MQQPLNIDHFKIERTLGKGAQGVVYLGVDQRLDRPVAIKTLFQAAHDEEAAALMREARAVSSLQHPNIVALYDIGTWEGRNYLVLEHVAGETLRERIKQGQMPVFDVLNAVLGMLDALAHAHAKGLVHRDIKPANVAFDSQGRARLMDFGISQTSATPPKALEAEELVGSGPYLAPEVISGQVATAASDLFSLGLVFYEMLTGVHPVHKGDTMATLYALAHEDMPAPSRRRSELDPALDTIVARALARQPEHRFASAAEMRGAIEEFLNHQGDSPDPGDAQHSAVLDYLLRKMHRNQDFPAFATHITEINRLTAVNSDATLADLANAVLKDYSLTNKLLRLVNSSMYCQFGGKVTTVSRAITIIGFENIRSLAVGLLLFDQVRRRPKARDLLEANLWSFVAAGTARALAAGRGGVNEEQAFIFALLARFGTFLAIYYLPDEYEEIRKLVEHKGLDQITASRRVLGVSLHTLGRRVARHLRFPPVLAEAMQPPATEKVKRAGSGEEMTLQLASFSAEIGDLLQAPGEDRGEAFKGLLRTYADAVPVDEQRLAEIVDDNLRAARALIEIPRPWLAAIEARISSLRPGTTPGEGDAAPVMETAGDPDGDGTAFALLCGVDEITHMLIARQPLNDVLIAILEVAYRALGLQRVILFVNNFRERALNARFGVGAVDERLMDRLRSPIDAANRIGGSFEAARDVLVSDAAAHYGKLPEWARKYTRSASFAWLPIVVDQRLIGAVYADAGEGDDIGAERFAHLQVLRNQASLAVGSRRK